MCPLLWVHYISLGMGIGVVLMCVLNVGKEADCEMKQLEESEDN